MAGKFGNPDKGLHTYLYNIRKKERKKEKQQWEERKKNKETIQENNQSN